MAAAESQKFCLLTGANRGIGLEFVRQLLPKGYNIIACCRNPSGATDLNALAAENEGKILVEKLEMTSQEELDVIAQKYNRVDLLILNAGYVGDYSCDFGKFNNEYSRDEKFLQVLHVNAVAPCYVVDAFTNALKAGEEKQIVALSSGTASLSDNRYGSGGVLAYRMSKVSLNMAVKNMANKLGGDGIHAFGVSPGWVATDLGSYGGMKAEVTTPDSVKNLLALIDGCREKCVNGGFYNYDGNVYPW